jgi:hypothetical protein
MHQGTIFFAAAIFPQEAVAIEGKRAMTPGGTFAPAAARRFSPALGTRWRYIRDRWMRLTD